ncbi:hypothetical protein A5662_12885 [Mycobacteriaceae bacterium 1482268.1]|nr:hypothetical protein A5662_12885 [Mycobacteriaceae bacterium 1482268.1]
MADYIHLGRKLMWVWDHPEPLEGASFPLLQNEIMRLSRDGPLFVSLLSPNDADELSRLCDAVATENGHTWRWQRADKAPQTEKKRGGFWRRRG